MPHGPLGELLVEQIPRLRRYARSLLRHPEHADDLVQDTLERAWSRLHLWQPDSDLRAWVFTIMHNLYANRVRRSVRQPDTGSLEDTVMRDPKQSTQEGAMNMRDLQSALDELPPEQREVLMLVCLEDLSYQEVAEVLSVPVGTVMSRLHRARERVRRALSGEPRPALRRVK